MSKPNSKNLDFLFHPRSIALVGIPMSNPDHWTRIFWRALDEFNFKGPIYFVNRTGGELEGRKVYQSLEEVPGPIDYVISTVSAQAGPGLILECAQKGVKAIQFCTAGFSEIADPDAVELESQLSRLGREKGIRILGPNCMGIYCPESRVSFRPEFPKESGPVGFISQSGGNTAQLAMEARWYGVRFSKAVSYGNACDLDECDFIEYLSDDPETKVIALYIEGVKNGDRFRRTLKKATRKKPVVLLKGGMTRGGAGATASHTGAMAGDDAIWDSMCSQLGVIRVHSLDEMLDVLVTLIFMPVLRGRNVALVGSGGGASVLIADEFEKQGLKVPALPVDIINQIRAFSHAAGNIFRNPVDYGQNLRELDKLTKMTRIVLGWEGVDFLALFLIGIWHPKDMAGMILDIVNNLRKVSADFSKPMALVFVPSISPEENIKLFPVIQEVISLGLPVYYSFARAARAMDLVLKNKSNHLPLTASI
ncbi:acetate--CoA ligase family protein [Thermodesulfobacteriota bacterium]